METDKRVESLENEFKLIRGELKQTLTSVRDHLLNLKLPPSQEAALLAAAIGGGGADVSMDGKFSFEKNGDKGKSAEEGFLGEEAAAEAEEEENPEPEMSEKEELADAESVDGELTAGEAGLSVPPVNLLANLIRWVANAKKKIGSKQLPTFLEVYGITGQLSPELKDVILHLAELTVVAESTSASTADIWSQLMLELHGILAGGDAPLRPLGSLWSNASDAGRGEPEKAKPPSKLKLVLSGGDGKDQEFCLDLKPEEE